MEDVSKLSSVIARWREAALGRALGPRPCEHVDAAPCDDCAALAAELSRTMKQFTASAISAAGAQVDYARLRASADYRAYRAEFLPRLAGFDPLRLTTRAEQLAFWINLYNALVIDAVITFGVQRSVTEGRLGVLTFFRRATYVVGGACTSCEDIEHGILRANRGNPFLPGPHFAGHDPRLAWAISPPDPRVHFALNCASRSCPPIGAYDAARIDAQLDLAARGFIDQSTHLPQDAQGLRVSSILRWYARDFGGRAGVIRFLVAHLPDDERRAWLESRGDQARLNYERYDWGLNAVTA